VYNSKSTPYVEICGTLNLILSVCVYFTKLSVTIQPMLYIKFSTLNVFVSCPYVYTFNLSYSDGVALCTVCAVHQKYFSGFILEIKKIL